MDEPAFTSASFHDAIQKQMMNVVIGILSETKMEWSQVSPFLESGRAICRDDIRMGAQLGLHGLEYEGAELVEAEEAYLSFSARDREDGVEWLQQTWWLSDIILSDDDPTRIRAALAAVDKSLDKVRTWLAEQEQAGGAAEAPPA